MDINITTLFDNYSLSKDYCTDWGFACVIKYNQNTILFDTGNDEKILFENMEKLNIDPLNLTHIFISHLHWDHVGGLLPLLQINNNVQLYIPGSALDDDIKYIKQYTKNINLINDVTEIVPGVFSLGDMPGTLNEQVMVLDVHGGSVIITGCAHPGIQFILDTFYSLFNNKVIKLLMGGFHLLHEQEQTLDLQIQNLKLYPINKICPSHCTGENAIKLIKNAFGNDYLEGGVGFTALFKNILEE